MNKSALSAALVSLLVLGACAGKQDAPAEGAAQADAAASAAAPPAAEAPPATGAGAGGIDSEEEEEQAARKAKARPRRSVTRRFYARSERDLPEIGETGDRR